MHEYDFDKVVIFFFGLNSFNEFKIYSMENNNEVWKDIPKYEGVYQISILGGIRRVLADNEHRILSRSLRGGSMCVVLSKNGMIVNHTIPVLIALTFLDYENKRLEFKINYKNSQKWDCRLVNLELIPR